MKKVLRCASLSFPLIACASSEPPKSSPITVDRVSIEDAGGFLCNDKSAQIYLGRKASSDIANKIINATGANTLRWIPPRTAITRDLREDRINIYYGDDLIITDIKCF